MVLMNAVLLAALPMAVEKKRDPVHFKRLFYVQLKHGTHIKTLTPPIETSAFTLFSLAVETNLSRSSSPPEIGNSSSEGVVSLGDQKGSTPTVWERNKINTHANAYVIWVYFFQVTLSSGRRSGCQPAHQAAATLRSFGKFKLRLASTSLEAATEYARTDTFTTAKDDNTTAQSATELIMFAERKRGGKSRTTPAAFTQYAPRAARNSFSERVAGNVTELNNSGNLPGHAALFGRSPS